MSYSQFGYSYPSSSQILVSGQHPGSVSPCCQSSGAAESHGSPPQTAAVCNLSAAYDSRLLSSFPRIATGFGLYGSSYADQGYISTLAGTNPSAFYSSLPSPYDLKESRNSWTALQQTSAPACYPYDPSGLASCGPYADRYSSIDSVARRKNATRETTNTLKAWLYEHRKNPYPTKGEKIMLAIITKMTLTQVSTWFANARRRLKKENKMTWEPRNKTSEGDDRDSSSPRDIKSDDNTEDCADSNLPDFLKQESGGYANKHSFPTEFEDPSIEPKPHNHTGKDCSSYGLDCYRVQGQSSEDSTNSGSPSPARPLQTSCYSDAQQRFESGKVDQKDSVFCPVEQNASSFGSGSSSRPKIWSLARTATSNSPPMIRRSVLPCPVDFCLEGGQKDEDDCAKMKPSGLSGGSCSYSDFTQDRTSGLPPRKHPTGDLCCDRSVYSSVLPSCGVPTKCESTSCLGSRESGSCMIDNHCSYAADYPPNLSESAEHYGYDDKHYKDKSVGSMGYPSTKCQPHDNSVVAPNPVPEKLSAAHPPGLLGYSENVAARNDYFSAGNFDQTLHEQNLRAIHKSSSNQDVAASMEMTDPGSLLRRSDH